MNQRVAGDDEALGIASNFRVCKETGIRIETDEDEGARQLEVLGLAALDVANGDGVKQRADPLHRFRR